MKRFIKPSDPNFKFHNIYLLFLRKQVHPLSTTGLIPILILVILNIRICKGIMLLHQRRTNRNTKEIRMTYIAIAIVTAFFVFNLPRIAAGTYEVFSTTTIINCIENGAQFIPSLRFFLVRAMHGCEI